MLHASTEKCSQYKKLTLKCRIISREKNDEKRCNLDVRLSVWCVDETCWKYWWGLDVRLSVWCVDETCWKYWWGLDVRLSVWCVDETCWKYWWGPVATTSVWDIQLSVSLCSPCPAGCWCPMSALLWRSREGRCKGHCEGHCEGHVCRSREDRCEGEI